MKRTAIFLYGIACYIYFLAVLLYMVCFVGNIWILRSLDAVSQVPSSNSLSMNIMLCLLFCVQHSVMARQWFKQLITKVLPSPMERSTYVLFTNAALTLLFRYWRPIGRSIWDFRTTLVLKNLTHSLYFSGWLLVFVSTLLINHFDLFGLRQVWSCFVRKPYIHLPFSTPGLYRYIRHPLYLGWLFVFWATPVMTFGHFVFSTALTAYIFIAIPMEERDLVTRFGQEYVQYREAVPMMVPSFK